MLHERRDGLALILYQSVLCELAGASYDIVQTAILNTECRVPY